MLHFSGAMQHVVKGFCKTLVINYVFLINELGFLDMVNKIGALQDVFGNIADRGVPSLTEQILEGILPKLIL